MRSRWKLLPAALAIAAALGAASCGGGGGGAASTLVFGSAADPVALDGAVVYDGESLRVVEQMFEGLTALEPGTTDVVPGLAESWETSEDGLTWTFTLKEGVTFHDGEPFNAEAVCFNFERWYNFPEAFQSDAAAYYWKYGFGGGFKNPGTDQPGPADSLYKSCTAVDETTVELQLTKPSAVLLSALTLPSLSMASPKALQDFNADEGTVDEEAGVFQPTGTYATEHPTGTGPYKFGSWTRSESLELVRNDDYHGETANLEKIIFRPISDPTARLQALQSGELDGYAGVEPQDLETVQSDDNLQLLERPALNVGYIAFNQQHPPLDKLEVRQAIAHAINRQQVVDTFYGGLGEVATQFQPPGIFGWTDTVTQYEFDPEKSKQLLQQAGLTLPVKIDFWYPTDVSRSYMPDPKRNFEAFSQQMENAGFDVVPHNAPWSPDYLGAEASGKYPVYLIGWIADLGDPDNFLGTFFQDPNDEFGFTNPEIHNLLDRAEQEADPDARTQLYVEANQKIMDFLPGLPYVHAKSALAFKSTVDGYVPSPVEVEHFSTVTIGEDSEETTS